VATTLVSDLSRNTSAISIIAYQCDSARARYSALAMVLPSNSTLRRLELGQPQRSNNDLALGKNMVLKSSKVDARRDARGSILDTSQYFSSRAIILWPEVPSMVE
jgi:hypothetical protein